MDWDKITKELQSKLNPDFVKEPPKGKYGQYIEGWHAIAEANRIFGFNGWSYTLDSLQLTNATRDGGSHRIGYMAQVTVCVDGVSRGDVGHGQGFGKSEGDAHDSAVKEAVTDALKRALRTFGNPFGLALYDKSKANVGHEANDSEIDAAVQGLSACATLDALRDYYGNLYRNMRHVADNPAVIEAKDYRKAELEQKDAA